MPKKKSKAEIIASYVSEHPDATWSTASADLERRGIKQGYFSTQRSKLKSEGAGSTASGTESAAGEDAATTGRKKRGPKKGSKRGAAASSRNGSLADAVEFARKAGGLKNAQALLEELARVQV